MRVCIICEKEPQGKAYAVKDDAVVRTIRGVKQRLGIARNNELFVCESCLPVYREKRKKFEKNLVLYVAIGVVIFVLLNGFQIMSGRFNFVTFLASVLIALLVAALAVLNYATPPLKGGAGAEAGTAPETPVPAPETQPRSQPERKPARETAARAAPKRRRQ